MAGADLHGLAVDAHSALEKLATGLGQAGADPQSIQAVSQMADVTAKIVKALGQGQAQTADNAPPVHDSAGDTVTPGAATDSAGQQIQGNHDSAGDTIPTQGQPPQHSGHTFASATADLHQRMVASAHARAAQGH